MQEEIRPWYNTPPHCLNNNSYASVNYIYVRGTVSSTLSGLLTLDPLHITFTESLSHIQSLTLARTHARGLSGGGGRGRRAHQPSPLPLPPSGAVKFNHERSLFPSGESPGTLDGYRGSLMDWVTSAPASRWWPCPWSRRTPTNSHHSWSWRPAPAPRGLAACWLWPWCSVPRRRSRHSRPRCQSLRPGRNERINNQRRPRDAR